MDCNPPGCSVHGTSRARILQWVVISSSRGLSTYPVPNSIFYKGLFTITATLGDKCFCVCVSHSVVSDSLPPHGLGPTRLLCSWDFPGKNTGLGCHFLLQGSFPTQRLNPRLLHWQADSLLLSQPEKPPHGRYTEEIVASCDPGWESQKVVHYVGRCQTGS